MIEYMYTCIYKMVNLLKSHDNLHGITYKIKVMLKSIAIVKHRILLSPIIYDAAAMPITFHRAYNITDVTIMTGIWAIIVH